MVITDVEQVTPHWLTETLTASGALQSGEVIGLDWDTQSFNKGYLSNIATLALTYSPNAQGACPKNLFLKMTKPDLHPELLGRSLHELEFYQAATKLGGDFPIPNCYDSAYDEATHLSHLLLDDLAPTHFQRPQPLPPSNHHCELIMESLARVHARWWNNPQLGHGLGFALTQADSDASHQRLTDTLPKFFDFLGDGLLPQYRQAYEKIMASNFLADLSERLMALKNVTLIHGDAHTGNLMLPHDPSGRVLLIDWHLWNIDLPTQDLAFLMALHWSPARRALLEIPLLQHYHAAFCANGPTNYAWDDFYNDYRRSVVIMALIPIGQFRRKSPNGVVWFGLQDSLAAFTDLHCEEVL